MRTFIINILPDLRYLSAVLLRAPAYCLPDFTAHAVNFPVDFRNGQRLFTALFRHQFRYAVFRRRDFFRHLCDITLRTLPHIFLQLRHFAVNRILQLRHFAVNRILQLLNFSAPCRGINAFIDLPSQMRFIYRPPEKIKVTGRIITRPTDCLHECRFTDSVNTADIKVIIMARFNILAGDKPLTSGTKITGCGFNLPDIGNPLFRKPELKLYRRIVNRKMRRGGYLKIARRQLNPRRRCRCGNPERYRRRVSLLPPGIYCPDCQPVVPRRQLPEAVCGFRRPGRADQPLTAIIRGHGQAKQEAHALHHLRRVPARQHLIFPAVCGDFCGQVLHRWRRDTIHRAALVAVKVRPVIHDGLFFRYMLHGSDGIRAVVVLTDTHAAEQALAQRRQLQPPHAVLGNAVRNTAHFYLHAVGDGLNLHADRIATSVNQAYQRGTGGW